MERDDEDRDRRRDAPPARPASWVRRRWWGVALSAVLAVAVAVPGLRTIVEGRDAPDGFPLSTYPMFTRDRGRVVEVPAVVAVELSSENGDQPSHVRRLSPSTIADTDQVMEAHNAVARAIREGAAASDELCRDVAQRLGEQDAGTTVQVVIEQYDAVEWAGGDDQPRSRRVIASCG